MIPFHPPSSLHFGPLTVNSHGLFFLIGSVAAFLWGRARVPARYRDHLENAVLWIAVGGIAGARLLYVAINPEAFSNPFDVLAVWKGGLVSYGGLFLALAGWWAYVRRHRLPLAYLNDCIAPCALLGWGLGRIGCLLTWYEEFGTVTRVPWAFVVDGGPPRHPVMGYEAAGLLAAAPIVAWLARRSGLRATGLALVAYGVVRIPCDFFRHWDPAWLGPASQGLALAILLAGLGVLARGRLRPEDLPPEEATEGPPPAEAALPSPQAAAEPACPRPEDPGAFPGPRPPAADP
ncbi:MAG TPA: prolipoprotein diacylglyceryl transferase [Candidatus Nitrosotenuis sp.]|jgi:phosphatidylglycerol:prolipoprotein diacylglycerol transferase|nr:prolipoprotein diacylglyceryl transferase [Candidatus Nitrosotenuis sp.]